MQHASNLPQRFVSKRAAKAAKSVSTSHLCRYLFAKDATMAKNTYRTVLLHGMLMK